jgi:excinuclease ABC subunit C
VIALMSSTADRFDSTAFLQQLTTRPGVYRMYDADGELLYVGKARNLRKRVGQYFLRASGDVRIESMVSQIRRIEVTVTQTEDEALILEANLIKDQRPRYNILYRDDKSYPLLRFTSHAYPRIAYYRGAKTGRDRYFGPFPSATAVRETLNTLQKLFLLRPCRDSFFAHRNRPCLQHQIKRCSAPCVGLISQEDYARDLANAARLLEGRGDELAQELTDQMDRAAEALDTRVEYGVWGGMTERQRRALLATHPEVSSWALFFELRRRASSAAVSSPCRSTGDVPQHQHGLEILRLGQPQVQAVVQRREHRRAAAENDR